MSAICGIWHDEGKPVSPETAAAMTQRLAVHPADAVGSWRRREIFLACHAQHVTPESLGETLPLRDSLAGLTITADAIIDNRDELCRELGLHPGGEVTDGRLILNAYRKWGAVCPEHLLGDFAFAVWDEKEHELFCAVDHTGTRTFYYYRSADVFAFSTLIKPLFVLPGIKRSYNETWMADFLTNPFVIHQLDAELTPYADICLLPAGHTLTLRPGRLTKRVYWTARRRAQARLKSDQEYEAAFRDVLGKAVRCRLRTHGQVGVMMSGGLDSTSVACLAARDLAREGRMLPVFTSVPMAGFRDWTPAHTMADESPFVEAVREHAGNMEVLYCRSEGRHPLSNQDELLAVLEQPYKALQNLFWMDGIMGQAQKRNIGVLLHAPAGNHTISWGYLQPYLLSLYRSGRWYRLLRESRAAARGSTRPLQAMRGMLFAVLPPGVQRAVHKVKGARGSQNVMDLSPVNPVFARRHAMESRLRLYGQDPLFYSRRDADEMRLEFLAPHNFSHFAVFTTKLGLAYKLAIRDPTMDKRVIEFCMGVPQEQFFRNGTGRFLVRRAMAGLVPDQVRLNYTRSGMQAADWTQRLEACWPEIAAEIRDIGRLESEREFLDLARILRTLDQTDISSDGAAHDPGLHMLIRSLTFSRFLRDEVADRP